MDKELNFEKVQFDTFQGINLNINITKNGFNLDTLSKCKKLYFKCYGDKHESNTLSFSDNMELGAYFSLIMREIFKRGKFDDLWWLLR